MAIPAARPPQPSIVKTVVKAAPLASVPLGIEVSPSSHRGAMSPKDWTSLEVKMEALEAKLEAAMREKEILAFKVGQREKLPVSGVVFWSWLVQLYFHKWAVDKLTMYTVDYSFSYHLPLTTSIILLRAYRLILLRNALGRAKGRQVHGWMPVSVSTN